MSMWDRILPWRRRRDDDYYDDYFEPEDVIGAEPGSERHPTGVGRPMQMGAGESEREPLDGTYTNPFVEDLGDFRWSAQREAHVIAAQELDPELWADGRMAFEFERTLAHQHEDVRQRLATLVEQQMSDEVEELTSQAVAVAEAMDEMKEADREAVIALREWRRVYDDVQRDETELDRYGRIRGSVMTKYKALKYLAWFGFVLPEAAITYLIFLHLVGQSPVEKAIALLLSLGVILAMVLIPHYAAVAIKEGATRRHKYELEAYQKQGLDPSYHTTRKVDHEEAEDRGSRILGMLICVLLVGAVIPLSLVRAQDFKAERVDKAQAVLADAQGAEIKAELVIEADQATAAANEVPYVAVPDHASALILAQGEVERAQLEVERAEDQNPWIWVSFFLLFQLLLSVYFFLREWNDHGVVALQLKHLEDVKREMLAKRREALQQMGDAINDYFIAAETLVRLIRQSTHWDHEVVSAYHATIRYLRHIVADAHPELQEFIHHATVPSLQSTALAAEAGCGFAIEPVSWDNAWLEADHTHSRAWIHEGMSAHTGKVDTTVLDEDAAALNRWLVQRDPVAFLEYILSRFGHEAEYQRPSELDDADYVDGEDPLDRIHRDQFPQSAGGSPTGQLRRLPPAGPDPDADPDAANG